MTYFSWLFLTSSSSSVRPWQSMKLRRTTSTGRCFEKSVMNCIAMSRISPVEACTFTTTVPTVLFCIVAGWPDPSMPV